MMVLQVPTVQLVGSLLAQRIYGKFSKGTGLTTNAVYGEDEVESGSASNLQQKKQCPKSYIPN